MPFVERFRPKARFHGCSGTGLSNEVDGSFAGVKFQKVASSEFCEAALPA